MVNLLLKKLNEQCPGKGSQWYADEEMQTEEFKLASSILKISER